uniref:Uncharacterized protein n=1 Tax=Musa acuminata subsp. malaccensis TaxID=214687 RepID=A0A804K171_MUSAM
MLEERPKLATQQAMHVSFYRDMMVMMFRKERERERLALRFDY